MLSEYELNIADLYNIAIGNFNLVPNVFDKKIHDSLWKLESLLKIRIEAKKKHRVLDFNQSQWLKQYVGFNAHKKKTQKKTVTNMEKHCTN